LLIILLNKHEQNEHMFILLNKTNC